MTNTPTLARCPEDGGRYLLDTDTDVWVCENTHADGPWELDRRDVYLEADEIAVDYTDPADGATVLGIAQVEDAAETEGTPEFTAAHGEDDDDTRRPAARHYVTGLPVLVTVDDNGWVTVEVDTSDIGRARDLDPIGDNNGWDTDADAATIARWATAHAVTNEGHAPAEEI